MSIISKYSFWILLWLICGNFSRKNFEVKKGILINNYYDDDDDEYDDEYDDYDDDYDDDKSNEDEYYYDYYYDDDNDDYDDDDDDDYYGFYGDYFENELTDNGDGGSQKQVGFQIGSNHGKENDVHKQSKKQKVENPQCQPALNFGPMNGNGEPKNNLWLDNNIPGKCQCQIDLSLKGRLGNCDYETFVHKEEGIHIPYLEAAPQNIIYMHFLPGKKIYKSLKKTTDGTPIELAKTDDVPDKHYLGIWFGTTPGSSNFHVQNRRKNYIGRYKIVEVLNLMYIHHLGEGITGYPFVGKKQEDEHNPTKPSKYSKYKLKFEEACLQYCHKHPQIVPKHKKCPDLCRIDGYTGCNECEVFLEKRAVLKLQYEGCQRMKRYRQ